MGCSNTKSVQVQKTAEQDTPDKTDNGSTKPEQATNGDVPAEQKPDETTNPANEAADKQTEQNTDEVVAEVLSGDGE